jgi:hypothetical protein
VVVVVLGAGIVVVLVGGAVVVLVGGIVVVLVGGAVVVLVGDAVDVLVGGIVEVGAVSSPQAPRPGSSPPTCTTTDFDWPSENSSPTWGSVSFPVREAQSTKIGFFPSLITSSEFGFWTYLHTQTLCGSSGEAEALQPVASAAAPLTARPLAAISVTARRGTRMVISLMVF